MTTEPQYRPALRNYEVDELSPLFPTFSSAEKVFEYGAGNSYPDTIEKLVLWSTTATASVETAAAYIGRLPDLWAKMPVNKEGEKLGDILLQINEQVAVFRAFALHANFNAAGEITDIRVIPFRKVRLGKMDEDGRIVKAYVKDWGVRQEKALPIHLWNPIPEVLRAQMASDDFNGQLMYYKMDGNKWIYPLSRLHPVIWDMEAEEQAARYKRNSLKKGFFGKLIVVTPPFDSGIYASDDEKAAALNKRKQFRESLKKFFGVDNVGNVMHLEVDSMDGDLEKAIRIEKIETNIDDRLFEYTEKSARDNIRAAMKNLPELLVRNTDGSLFGVGGSSILEARRFYSAQWERERQAIAGALHEVLVRWAGDLPAPVETFDVLENVQKIEGDE